MNVSTLDPPNAWLLSDEVIGAVELRIKKRSIHVDSSRTIPTSSSPELQSPKRQKTRHVSATATPQWRGAIASEVLPMDVDIIIPRREPLANSKRVKTSRPADQHQLDEDVVSFISLTKEAIQRRDRRDKQRRYRKKQRDMMLGLEQETEKLRRHIDRLLEQQQRALTRTIPGATCVWNVAAEYFRLFEFGLLELKSTQQLPSSSSDAVEGIDVSSDQMRFLRSTLAADVVSNEGRGVDAVICSWRRTSFWLKEFKLELKGLQKIGASSVAATTKTTFTITERTLRNVFPSVWEDRESALGSGIVNKLLGQSISMRGTTRFVWDSMRCRLTSVLAQSDLLTPMLRLLGGLDDVERVFAKALISPDFRWVARS